MPETAIIIQARLGSHRLPRKILWPIEGRTVLEHVVHRSLETDIGPVVIAFPASEPEMAPYCDSLGVNGVAGPEFDVLARYVAAAEFIGADRVIRVTADCPLVDPQIITEVADVATDADYGFISGFPRGVGDVELISATALQAAANEATEPYDREHVIPYVTRSADRFRVVIEEAPASLYRPDYRVCIDEEADVKALVALHEACTVRPIAARNVVETLDLHPEIVAINRNVKQRS